MPDANSLTYQALQNAVLGRRFPAATQTDNAKRWLSTAYTDVWTAVDWTFKRVSRQALTMTNADSTPTMPADFGQVLDLYDDSGVPLVHLGQDEFEGTYGDVLINSQTGLPEAYMVVNRQIHVAPLPTGTTFYLSYVRRLSHRQANGDVAAGFMIEPDDYPLWDDHHALLIPRAVSIGLQEINDPTWSGPQEEYERQLARMERDYVVEYPARQWGAISWDS
jgi:hypothetical protein